MTAIKYHGKPKILNQSGYCDVITMTDDEIEKIIDNAIDSICQEYGIWVRYEWDYQD